MKKEYKDIDVRSGDITLQQYGELREVFVNLDKLDIVTIYKKIAKILLNKELEIKDFTEDLTNFVKQVANDMKYWAEMEAKYLNYKPSKEEIQAGIKNLNKDTSFLSTAKQLGKDYGIDPDVVLDKWKWSKVFILLKSDLEENDYMRRLNEIILKKK